MACEGAAFRQGSGESAAPGEEELAGRRLHGEADRAVVRLLGGGRPAQAPQEMRAYGPVWLVRSGGGAVDPVEPLQAVRRPLRLAHGSRLRHMGAECRREGHEVLVEDDDRRPVGSAALGAFDVDRLDGGLELEATESSEACCRAELLLRLADRVDEPGRGILL
jgi:hypothetical protein